MRFGRNGLLAAAAGAALVACGARIYLSADCCKPSTVLAQEKNPLGGDLIPLRQVVDPYAVFNGIAVEALSN